MSFHVYSDYPPDNPPPRPPAGYTRFICISDTHSHVFSPVPPGDVLLHAGDLSRYGSPQDVQVTLKWLKELEHPIKIIIAGNHDLCLDENYPYDAVVASESDVPLQDIRQAMRNQDLKDSGIFYLQYEPFTFQSPSGKQWHVFGSPASPVYARGAFQYEKQEAKEIHSLIPRSTEILLTHTPPYRTLDKSRKGRHVGCLHLQECLLKLSACRLHVFGHIHEAYGAALTDSNRIAVNAALAEAPCAIIVDLKDNI